MPDSHLQAPTFPKDNLIANNHMHEVGVYGYCDVVFDHGWLLWVVAMGGCYGWMLIEACNLML